MKTTDNSHTTTTTRSCGDCAKCCQGWLQTIVLEIKIDLDQPCPYCTDDHCSIHATRPEDPCRIFFCGWAEADSRLPQWMQPSQCGVIVLTGRSSWRGHPVDVLVSAGRDPDEKLLSWFHAHSRQHLRPFIYQQQEQWFGFGPPAFQEHVAAKASRGEPLWT